MSVTSLARSSLVFSFALVAAAPVPADARVASGPSASSQPRCRALAGMRIGATRLGLPTRGAIVTAAETVAADGKTPAHCLVSGSIAPVDPKAPDIRFQVALPLAWNGKALMMGGGGFNGTIPKIQGNFYNMPADAASPLARGYAVYGGDSGHRATDSEAGAFLLNDEAYWNWIGNALKKTRDAATAVIARAYGRVPARAYFIGGSTGGREGLMVAGRWPADWDGVVSLYPARTQMTHMIGGMAIDRALAAPGAYPNPAKRGVLFAAALEACDMLDGAKDGLITNVRACNARFRPAEAMIGGRPLRCPGGGDTGDTCLSDAQLGALAKVNQAFRFNFPMKSGATLFPGFNVYTSDTGIPKASPLQPMVTFLALGAAPPAHPATKQMSLAAQFGDDFIRYGIARDASIDPLSIDPANPGRYAARLSYLSAVDASDENLDAFARRGGKIILVHGTADMIVTPRVTEIYYEGLRARMGPRWLDGVMRFYEIAGFGHAISTNFNAAFDYLTALEHWRERGRDPGDDLIVTDTTGVPGRTRPLCRYPTWPRYKASGDLNSSTSYFCTDK